MRIMSKTWNVLSFDFGAGSGRSMLGRFDGERLSISECLRFSHNIQTDGNSLCWDISALEAGIMESFQKLHGAHTQLCSFAIDTWGVDFALLDKNGTLVEQPRCYRRMSTADLPRVHQIVDENTLFQKTGLIANPLNTLYQLIRMRYESPQILEKASHLLMLPSYFSYLLTGEIYNELTAASTTMLLDVNNPDWSHELIAAFSLPDEIFQRILSPGTLCGAIRSTFAAQTGYPNLAHVYTGTLDTASAVATVTTGPDSAYCSSGTWSLFGVESDYPILSAVAQNNSFANERTVQKTWRPIQDINGLWIVQEWKKEITRQGRACNWNTIVAAAAASEPFRSIVNVDDEVFFSPGDMTSRIQQYCQNTAQPLPESIGQIARCIYDSLALRYRRSFDQCRTLTGKQLNSLNIIGGGSQNTILNQTVADLISCPVIAGPIEASSIGNMLMQLIALGAIHNLEEGRALLKASFPAVTIEPQKNHHAEDAYGFYLHLLKNE